MLITTKPTHQKGVISLAHVSRRRTEVCTAQRKQWIKKRLEKRSRKAQRTYKPAEELRQDPVAAAASKRVASRYYQLKIGHAAVGEFLQRRDAQASAACRWCQASRESVGHLLFECWEWQRQRRTLRGDLIQAKMQYPTAAEEIPEARLFGNRKAMKALLAFIATTGVGA